MIKGKAPMRLELEFDGTADELVNMVDALALAQDGQGLDSLDAGDAMGWVITQTFAHDCEFSVTIGPRTLKATIVFDLFEWEGLTN